MLQDKFHTRKTLAVRLNSGSSQGSASVETAVFNEGSDHCQIDGAAHSQSRMATKRRLYGVGNSGTSQDEMGPIDGVLRGRSQSEQTTQNFYGAENSEKPLGLDRNKNFTSARSQSLDNQTVTPVRRHPRLTASNSAGMTDSTPHNMVNSADDEEADCVTPLTNETDSSPSRVKIKRKGSGFLRYISSRREKSGSSNRRPSIFSKLQHTW